MSETFSYFTCVYSTLPLTTCGMDGVIETLTSDVLKKMIEQVRMPKTKWMVDDKKRQLPTVTFNGEFSLRNNDSLVSYSGLTPIDLDDLNDEELKHWREVFKNLPETVLLFTSPSGHGLKVIVRHDLQDPSMHHLLYAQLLERYIVDLGCDKVDKKTKDISRATFLSYDPNYYYNPDATPYHFDVNKELTLELAAPKSAPVNSTVKSANPMTPEMKAKNQTWQMGWKDKALMDYVERKQWLRFMEDYQQGNRNDSLLKKSVQLFRLGVDYDAALEKLNRLYGSVYADVPEKDVEDRLNYAYRTNPEEDFGVDRAAWLERRNQGKQNFNNNFKTHNYGKSYL